MTDVASGNQPANPTPAPAPADLEGKVASHAPQIREAFQKAAAGQADTGAPAEPKEPAVDVPTFFAKKVKDAPPAFDPTKLSPELQEVYKSMQADFTQKWQSASDLRKQAEDMRTRLDDERRVMLENQKTLLDALKAGRGEIQPPAGAEDPLSQINALREEGRHAEADQLFAAYLNELAEAKVAPMKKEAELNVLKTTFRDTASEVTTNNPVVARYKADVSAVFDGDNPMMQALRPYLFQSENTIRTFVPLVLNAIATEIHAKTLEERFDKEVERRVNTALEARKASAARVPAKLVESGSVSRSTAPGKMSLAESFTLAKTGTEQ